MMHSVASFITRNSPEKLAARELENVRWALFQAQRRLIAAQMHVAYYRGMLAFLEDVQASRLECVVEKRHAQASPEPTQSSLAAGLPNPPMAPFST